jgi:peptide chain release factor 1
MRAGMAIIERLEDIDRRAREVAEALSRPDIASDGRRFRELAREHARLERGSQLLARYREATTSLDQAKSMLVTETDPEILALAEDEAGSATHDLLALEDEIRFFLIPPDPQAGRDIIVELRAGTGGDESALFVADLLRMYSRYAEENKQVVELLSSHPTGLGGFKEIIFSVSGDRAWELFRFESGTHRVQRVPETESGGRTHTSAATVAVMPEAEESEVVITDRDVRIDVYRSSGPGGQSVNTTDSAVRITHLPTGLVVICQDEKSQHKNKAKALKVLRARLAERMEAERNSEMSAMRKSQIGSGDRSERIRTYNFNENRVTDHRIHETWHKLPEILAGNLSEVVAALEKHRREGILEEIASASDRV